MVAVTDPYIEAARDLADRIYTQQIESIEEMARIVKDAGVDADSFLIAFHQLFGLLGETEAQFREAYDKVPPLKWVEVTEGPEWSIGLTAKYDSEAERLEFTGPSGDPSWYKARAFTFRRVVPVAPPGA